MMPIFLLIIFTLTGCDTKLNQTGNYAPGEYVPYLHVGNTSSITLSDNNIVSGNLVTAIIVTKDSKNQPINQGGAKISLRYSGDGSVAFGQTQDNLDGTYSIPIQPIKSGTVSIKVSANNQVLTPSANLDISPGPIDPAVSDIFISRVNYLVGDTATVYFTPKDLNGNIVEDPNLYLYPTITNGTSTATIDSFIYSQGKYLSSLTATGAGTPSQLNISIRDIGITTSVYPVKVTSTRPNYTRSNLTISKSTVKTGQAVTVNIYVKDASGNIINLDNMPISLEFYDGTSQVSISSVTKYGNYYSAFITGTSPGTAGRIRAKVDGEYTLTTGEILSFQVTP